MSKMKIAWLFPDTLYLHGERGNILALERCAEAAGFDTETVRITFDTQDFDPLDYDIIFCPPGEITSFPVVLEKLRPLKDKFLEFIEAGRPLIVTGTSMAMWCEEVRRTDGSSFSGMGIIAADVSENEEVYGDDIWYTCEYNGNQIEVIGCQIQMADFISKGEAAFGKLKYGYGNTGNDRAEGFIRKNSIFTNTLGPVLVANPELTKNVIKAAAAAKGEEAGTMDLDTSIEESSFEVKKQFISTKVTRLKNCLD